MRNRLFVLVTVRSMQLPLLAWARGRDHPRPGGESSSAPRSFGRSSPISPWRASRTGRFTYRQLYALELGENVVRDLRMLLLQHLFTLPMAYFHRTKVGRVISRMTSDIEAVRLGVQNFLFVGLVQCGQMLSACVLMALL